VTNRETCYNLVPSDYPVTISKVSAKRKEVELEHVFTSTVRMGTVNASAQTPSTLQ
jgi:hypothetical protein